MQEQQQSNDDGASTSKEDAPANKSRRARGFAFVWYVRKDDAERALAELNGSRVYAGVHDARVKEEGDGRLGKKREVRLLKKQQQQHDTDDASGAGGEKGRLMIVDWALGKKEYDQNAAAAAAPTAEEEGAAATSGEEEDDEESSDEGEESELEDEDSDDEDPVEDDEQDESDDGDRDVSEQQGTTLFVRNVPFETTEQELYNLFKAFGPVRYARVVFDPTTKRSRGTGFVCFWRAEDAQAVLEESAALNAETTTDEKSSTHKKQKKSILMPDPSSSTASRLRLHGRVVAAVPAVSREDADRLREDRDIKGKGDRRNLYLMREGVIFPGLPRAKELHASDMTARQASFEARKSLLRSNPSLYISRTRLSIRQIPLFVTDRMLKKLAKHALHEFDHAVKKGVQAKLTREELDDRVVDAGSLDVSKMKPALAAVAAEDAGKKLNKRGVPISRVRQAKVLRQTDRVDPLTGLGRSKGYGFVEMASHADALRVLRWANANKDVDALLRAWWRDELQATLDGGSVKDEQKKRLKEKLEELKGGDKSAPATERNVRSLIIEFSIENTITTQRRAEKVLKARERAKKGQAKPGQNPGDKRKRAAADEGAGEDAAHKKQKQDTQVLGSIIGRKRREKRARK